ncbi:MAG: methyltransferase [Limisphaerales bacterium]
MKEQTQPSPDLFFDTITSYQKTAALKAAVELDLFTVLAQDPATACEVAVRCNASPRGVRMLCDYMTVLGFLGKSGDKYHVTQDSAVFLNRKSPAYAGGAIEFLLSDELVSGFNQLTAAVRRGGTTQSAQGSTAPEHPMWITFARVMGGLMVPASHGLAGLIPLEGGRAAKVLDVSASHGMWGIAFAQRYPDSQLVALDWAPVLEVAKENARAAGVLDRFSTINGSAFDVDLGKDYDLVLVPNFLHHFSSSDCICFLKKAHAALRSGGRIAIVEFIPNPDRISPAQAAGFSIVMLATTPDGDAYTAAEYSEMLSHAGFNPPTLHDLPASVNKVLIAVK